MAELRSFRDLGVYKLALSEATRVFIVTKKFPAEERYSLTDQIRRSSRAGNALLAESFCKSQRNKE
jgi:four helix bundle protein